MSASRTQTHAVASFVSLGDQCPDTCCKGWGMQLTPETITLYKERAPHLLDAVTSGEAEFIMKRDAATDYCVKFDAGWCGIHRDHGPEFLGDACNFYPRVTRALDEQVVMAIALSCPEAARTMLYDADPFARQPRQELRIPFSLRNYLPPGSSAEAALAVHQRCVDEAGNLAFTPERNLMRLSAVARALELQPVAQWQEAAGFYFTMAEGRLPPAEPDANDLIHLIQALVGLILASKSGNRTGLMAIAQNMQDVLGVTIDPVNRSVQSAPDVMQRGVRVLRQWQQLSASAMQPLLRRYLQAQLSQAMFPYAGLGETLTDRITIIAVRFATLKLALMAHTVSSGAVPGADDIVRITYTLARFLDHLANPTLSLAIYQETGWRREARLRALVGDA